MKVLYSLVVPVFNEEESLEAFMQEVRKTFSGSKQRYEIVFVDDGSRDRSFELLRSYEKKYENVRLFSFRRNLGKARALTKGFIESRGEYIVTLDADLQDDPSEIERLQKEIEKHDLDMVSGWRKNRADSSLKVVSSKLFNGLVSFMFGITVHDLNCGLKMYKSDVAKELILYGGMHRFIPVIAHEMGYKTSEVAIVHHKRKFGVSKYKPTKIISDIPDLLTIFFLAKYDGRPLHFFGKVGGVILFVGSLILLYLSILWVLGQPIGTRPLLLFGILLFLTGIQTIFTGLIADLVVNSNEEQYSRFPMKYESS